jgi:hypothetical protein
LDYIYEHGGTQNERGFRLIVIEIPEFLFRNDSLGFGSHVYKEFVRSYTDDHTFNDITPGYCLELTPWFLEEVIHRL